MSESKTPNRIPFESLSNITPWRVPEVDGKLVPKEKKAKKVKPPTKDECIEELDNDTPIQPLTAEGLEEIAAAVQAEAYEKGYQEGLAKGMLEGEANGFKTGEAKAYTQKSEELNNQICRVKEISEQLLKPTQIQACGLENIVLDMAVGFAKHLVGKQFDQNPIELFGAVQRVIESLPVGASHIKIYLSPDDLECIQSCSACENHHWQFKSDTSMARGGVKVETGESLIDYSVEARIKRFIEDASHIDSAVLETLEEPKDYHAQWQENKINDQEKIVPEIGDNDNHALIASEKSFEQDGPLKTKINADKFKHDELKGDGAQRQDTNEESMQDSVPSLGDSSDQHKPNEEAVVNEATKPVDDLNLAGASIKPLPINDVNEERNDGSQD